MERRSSEEGSIVTWQRTITLVAPEVGAVGSALSRWAAEAFLEFPRSGLFVDMTSQPSRGREPVQGIFDSEVD